MYLSKYQNVFVQIARYDLNIRINLSKLQNAKLIMSCFVGARTSGPGRMTCLNNYWWKSSVLEWPNDEGGIRVTHRTVLRVKKLTSLVGSIPMDCRLSISESFILKEFEMWCLAFLPCCCISIIFCLLFLNNFLSYFYQFFRKFQFEGISNAVPRIFTFCEWRQPLCGFLKSYLLLFSNNFLSYF